MECVELKITQAYLEWVRWLPEILLYYDVSYDRPEVLQHMHSLGIQFYCDSKKEIEDVLQVSPSIVFAHPVKIQQHIEYACEQGVKTLVFDSISELYKIKQAHPTAELLLHLRVQYTGVSKKFGAEMQNVPTLLMKAKTLNLNVIGFSFHVVGEDPYVYCEALQLCSIACDIAMTLDVSITTIDIGGIPWSTFEACAQQVRRGMQMFHDKIFIGEIGRYLVESLQ